MGDRNTHRPHETMNPKQRRTTMQTRANEIRERMQSLAMTRDLGGDAITEERRARINAEGRKLAQELAAIITKEE